MSFLDKLWEVFRGSVRGVDTSKQLALGVMLGMVVGLLPKDSLLPYFFVVVTVLSNANLLTALISGVVFSWISPHLDSVTHPIGLWVLTFDPLESFWIQLVELPWVAWLRIENTVVTGSLTLALLLCLPMHAISHQLFDRFGSAIYQRWSNSWIASWLSEPEEPELENNFSN